MKQKEYPMGENYNQALQFLTDQIAERDKLKKQLIILSSKERPKVMRLLDELDKVIERSEQALAEEYEATQKVFRLEEERDEQLDDLVRSLAGAYVHVKYRNPEMLAEMEAKINNMPPEQAQQFYDCAARLEAGDLIRIIAQKGETPEETEEFLRNFRAAESKRKLPRHK